MSQSSWIRNLFASRHRVSRKAPARGRLAVETLEDRVTPAAIGLSTPETYVEDTPLDLADIVVSGSVNASATLTLSNTAAGSLSTATSGSVTSTFDAATGAWTATGPIADVNVLLAEVTFTPSSDFNGDSSIATSITDDSGTSIGDKLMDGTPVNDQPTVTVPGQQTAKADVGVRITGISIADVDVSEGTGEIEVTLSAASGTISVGTAVAGGLLAAQISGNGTSSVVLQGPIDAVNATLAAGVIYRGNVNFTGADTLSVVADDLGNTGAGGALTATATVSIQVLSPAQQVTAIRQMVQDLAAAGAFKNKGRLNSLLTKLRQIDAALARGQGKVAFNVAGAFINHVRAFRNARILTPAQADPLIAAATQLRTSLQIGGFAVTTSTAAAASVGGPGQGHGNQNGKGKK